MPTITESMEARRVARETSVQDGSLFLRMSLHASFGGGNVNVDIQSGLVNYSINTSRRARFVPPTAENAQEILIYEEGKPLPAGAQLDAAFKRLNVMRVWNWKLPPRPMMGQDGWGLDLDLVWRGREVTFYSWCQTPPKWRRHRVSEGFVKFSRIVGDMVDEPMIGPGIESLAAQVTW